MAKAKEEKKYAVTFLEKVPPYNAGETAGFPKKRVKQLVKGGKAVLVGEDLPPDLKFIEKPVAKSKEATDGSDNGGGIRPDLLDILDQSIEYIDEAVQELNDSDEYVISDEGLQQLLQAEKDGKTRKGAVEAIEAEIARRSEEE